MADLDLSRQVGPGKLKIPLWGWAAVGIGGWYIYSHYFKGADAAAAASDASALDQPYQQTGIEGPPGPKGRGERGHRGPRGKRGPKGPPPKHHPHHRQHHDGKPATGPKHEHRDPRPRKGDHPHRCPDGHAWSHELGRCVKTIHKGKPEHVRPQDSPQHITQHRGNVRANQSPRPVRGTRPRQTPPLRVPGRRSEVGRRPEERHPARRRRV